MELRHINTFIKLAQIKSFSKAASEMGYSQSAVTVQIRNLEEELGVKLFDRIGKRVTLTHQGERFLAHANNIVKEMSAAKESMRVQEKLTGSLRIGTIESLCFSKFPSVLKYFYHNHPDVNVQLITGSPKELFDKMEHDQADIIYILDRPIYQETWVKALEIEEEIVFVAAADFFSGGNQGLKLNDIIGEKFFLTERDANYRRELDTVLAARKMHIIPFLEISNTEFIIKLVKEGMGMSFLPKFAIEEGIERNELVIVRPEDFHISMWRQVFYHKDKWVTPEMLEFIRLAEAGM